LGGGVFAAARMVELGEAQGGGMWGVRELPVGNGRRWGRTYSVVGRDVSRKGAKALRLELIVSGEANLSSFAYGQM
jgi:hypothetical protein